MIYCTVNDAPAKAKGEKNQTHLMISNSTTAKWQNIISTSMHQVMHTPVLRSEFRIKLIANNASNTLIQKPGSIFGQSS